MPEARRSGCQEVAHGECTVRMIREEARSEKGAVDTQRTNHQSETYRKESSRIRVLEGIRALLRRVFARALSFLRGIWVLDRVREIRRLKWREPAVCFPAQRETSPDQRRKGRTGKPDECPGDSKPSVSCSSRGPCAVSLFLQPPGLSSVTHTQHPSGGLTTNQAVRCKL